MIGSYVFQIKQCLTKIAGMSTKEVLTHYGFSEELAARNLKTRATGVCGAFLGSQLGQLRFM